MWIILLDSDLTSPIQNYGEEFQILIYEKTLIYD